MSDPISRIEREREIVEMITMPHNNNSNRSTAPNALLQPPPPPPPPQLPTMTNKDDISGDEGGAPTADYDRLLSFGRIREALFTGMELILG